MGVKSSTRITSAESGPRAKPSHAACWKFAEGFVVRVHHDAHRFEDSDAQQRL